MISVLLGLICVLLLVAIIVQHNKHSTERDLMKMNYSQLNDEREELQNRFNSMNQKKLELETNYKYLTDEKEELKKTLKSLREKKLELETKGYFISIKKKSWSESRQFCRDRGQDLVIINTEDEQRYVSSIAKSRVWIGLSDIAEEGKMKWVDNTTLDKKFWYQGEPNDENGNEDCVEIMSSSQPILNNWNDLPCSETRKCICENLRESMF
ncbi:collectin-12-like [Misgurnus anguillicaudatus]|uniref:collectin-12-like n=1 Tax=Misgurnus anguillicaudatus TaxID=75329 RepID=UPI003CCEFE14